MLARRFLWIVVGLVMLALTASVTYRLFGQQIMRAALVPSIAFAESRQDAAPDYRRPAMWLSRPDLPDDPSRWAPQDYRPAPKPAIATFYVSPTTYLRRDRWNSPFDDSEANDRARQLAQIQATAFNGISAVWAPRYRQATFGAFLTDRRDADLAVDFAYRDIARAFDTFIASIPSSRPIILVGHSQGTLHLMRLMKEKIAGTPLAKRIIAAYLVGWPVSVENDLPALGLPACTAAGEANCVLSWQSFAEPADFGLVREAFDTTIGLTGRPNRGTQMLCVNPLTGQPGSAAGADNNLGALRPTSDYRSVELVPGMIPAHCASGYLVIGSPPTGFGRYVLPGNNFHVYDYALFWANVRADAEARASGYVPPR